MCLQLNQTERDWMIAAAKSDYHAMFKLLNKHAYLAKRKVRTLDRVRVHTTAVLLCMLNINNHVLLFFFCVWCFLFCLTPVPSRRSYNPFTIQVLIYVKPLYSNLLLSRRHSNACLIPDSWPATYQLTFEPDLCLS